ncbi:hypothetical protein P7K49_028506, partial [Saguinus oedipus]
MLFAMAKKRWWSQQCWLSRLLLGLGSPDAAAVRVQGGLLGQEAAESSKGKGGSCGRGSRDEEIPMESSMGGDSNVKGPSAPQLTL